MPRSLTWRFVVLTGITLLISISFFANWVSREISDSVVLRNAENAALYMTSFLAPNVQSLTENSELTPSDIAALETVSRDISLRRHILAIKIWAPDGTILFSTDRSLVGKRFDAAEISEALQGKIVAYYDALDKEENAHERSLGKPVYEIYVPLNASDSDRVIAVGEFYEDATLLHREVLAAGRRAWFVAGATGLAIFVILLGVVAGGDGTIRRQQENLARLREDYARLEASNAQLQQEIEAAQTHLANLDKQIQRRIGLELHDGPAQLLTAVLLNLDAFRTLGRGGEGEDSAERTRLFTELRNAAAGALEDLRAISRGLFLAALDQSEGGATAFAASIADYEKRTGRRVERSGLEAIDLISPERARVAATVVSEALNNGYKHAPGARQAVRVWQEGNVLSVEVSDDGPGIANEAEISAGVAAQGIGLKGMRYRVESVGGQVAFMGARGVGTKVVFRFPVLDSDGATAA